MPVDQAVELTVTATQTAVETAVAVTPDQVGGALDTVISIGNSIPHSQGSWIAIALAALVVARMVWKKYKVSKK